MVSADWGSLVSRTLRFSYDATSLVFCLHFAGICIQGRYGWGDRGFRQWFWGIPLPVAMPSGGALRIAGRSTGFSLRQA